MSRELLQIKEEKKTLELETQAPLVTELKWESPLQVLRYPDPRLRAVNGVVTVFDESLRKLAQEMFEVMYDPADPGVGLAAPQVGVNVRLMVLNATGERGKGEEVVLVNPRIISTGKATEVEEEACLSFPGMGGDIERAVSIKVKAQDVTGKKFQLNITDPWVARIFQHEYDHLQGTLYPDRMTPSVLSTVKPRLVQLEEDYITANPDVEFKRY